MQIVWWWQTILIYVQSTYKSLYTGINISIINAVFLNLYKNKSHVILSAVFTLFWSQQVFLRRAIMAHEGPLEDQKQWTLKMKD